MAEKKVIVCDRCEKNIATGKCDICKKDLCNLCNKKINLSFDKDAYSMIISVGVCLECKKRSNEIIKKDIVRWLKYRNKPTKEDFIIPKMNKTFVELVRAKGILDNLEKE
jgi:hypothetical protein